LAELDRGEGIPGDVSRARLHEQLHRLAASGRRHL
jgi:hypothetical protein